MAYAMIGNAPRPKKTYIATRAFNNDFWSYTVSGPSATSFATTGRLALLSASNSAVTAVTCPAGRLLREIGASLYPGVNPGLQVGDTNYNATAGQHRWVKVYDAITGFNGYIDPNGAGFATYSTDRPEEFADINESNGATGADRRLGQSLFTNGNLTFGGQLSMMAIGLSGTSKAILYVATNTYYDFSYMGTVGAATGNTTNGGRGLYPYYTFLPTAAVALNATVSTTGVGVPSNGTVITIFYLGQASGVIVTPALNFIAGTVTTPSSTTGCIAVTYVSNGIQLVELYRSGTLTSIPTLTGTVAAVAGT